MNKKGASHVDWAISMGLFIIYTLSLFLFLRPGIEDPINQSVLIKIAEKGFYQQTNVTLEQTPILVDYQGDSGINQLQINFKKGELSGEDSDYTMENNQGERLSFSVSRQSERINFETTISKGTKRLFWLLYMEDALFTNNMPNGALKKEPEDFTYELGITEKTSGISQSKLVKLENKENLKALFNFPEDNEFEINVIDSESFDYEGQTIIHKYSTTDEESEENVFVKEFRENILNNDGTREKIIVNIRVW
jgi:hypothetical protein